MGWNPSEAVAVVTGASSGIGRCLCELLLKAGTHVVPVARRGERLKEFTQQYQSVYPVAGDITDQKVRESIVETAASIRNQQVDLLVNNAGIGAIGPFADAGPQRLRQIMEVNFFAPVELTRAMIPLLREGRQPVICNVSSVLGHRAVPDKSEYCASKFAMHGFSDSLRAELAPDGIQVTLVSPSTTSSEFFESLVDTQKGQTSKSIGSWPPEKVASATLAAIKRRRSEVIFSFGGKALVYADRMSPPMMNSVLRKRRAD